MKPSPTQLAFLHDLAAGRRPRTRRSGASCVARGWVRYYSDGLSKLSGGWGYYDITPAGRAVLAAAEGEARP